jgi:hypothetical protein
MAFTELEAQRRRQRNNPSLTTEQKLQMTVAGSLSEYQKKELERLLSLRIVLQSNMKLKKKLKSKKFQVKI